MLTRTSKELNQMQVLYKALFRKKTNKQTIKLIGHHARLRDVMDQSYPICVCARADHARYSSVHVTFCGSWMRSLLN